MSGLNVTVKQKASDAAAGSGVSLSDLSTGFSLTGSKALVASDLIVYTFLKQ